MFAKPVSSFKAAAAVALYFVLVLNLALWRFVWRELEIDGLGTLLFALSLPVCLFLLIHAVVHLLLWPYVGKAAVAALIVLSAVANYYMFNLNVFIDLAMIRNVFATNPNEVGEMIGLDGVLWVALTGVLPAALLCLVRIDYRPPLRELGGKALAAVSCLAVVGVLGLAFFKDFSATARNNKMVEHLINPSNYLNCTYRYAKRLNRQKQAFTVVDPDPRLLQGDGEPYKVLVLVVGETARSMNFSLNGYERNTNPRLGAQDVASYRNVTASGTLTAFSVPCMFSHLPRERFDVEKSYYQENLLDILEKAGYDILWLDNGVGSKGVSQRVATVNLKPEDYPEYRSGDYLYDGVFIKLLEDALARVKTNTVIVIHMIGSHGPSYHMRFPGEFAAFTPSCDTVDIQKRPREEIVNVYDNTIVYTDYVLSGCIDVLKKDRRHESAMLYVSDHGESLGENGLYLHGFPYAFAPDEQTRVPMILWLSDSLKETPQGYDFESIKADARVAEASHDNYFHTVLGMAEVDSGVYDGSLDLLSRHRKVGLTRSRGVAGGRSRPTF